MMKEKLVMFVYGDITSDARVQRSAEALSSLYDVTVISTQFHKSLPNFKFNNKLVGNGFSTCSYIRCLYEAIRYAKSIKPYIIYGHDFYSAPFLDYFLRKNNRKFKAVYDAHELIIPEPEYPLKGKARLINRFESYAIKNADLVLCAKKERGEVMVDHYGLSVEPAEIKNISQLSVNPDSLNAETKFALDAFLKKPGLTVVYAGAVMKQRRIGEIARAVVNHPDKYKLLIVGDGDQLEEIKEITSQNRQLESFFTGKVPYAALGYILSKCDIGFIYYPNTTINNRLCASNKLYEYASINLPILANNNPTVQKDVEKYDIGVVTDDFEQGLELLSKRIAECKANCKVFSAQNQWEDEADKLRNVINQL